MSVWTDGLLHIRVCHCIPETIWRCKQKKEKKTSMASGGRPEKQAPPEIVSCLTKDILKHAYTYPVFTFTQ